MDKLLINTKGVLKAATVCILIAATAQATVRNVTRIEEFSDPNLSPFWTLDDEPASYTTDPNFPLAGFVMDGAVARFNEVGNNAYAHIETASTIESTGVIRADAIMRQDNSSLSTWGMGVGIYFDQNNWVSLKQGAAGGQNGWMRQSLTTADAGAATFQMSDPNFPVSLRSLWLISGVELTTTQIKFYGSSILPLIDHFGETNIDGNVSEITELAMVRPATFTGPALVIIGKGFTDGARPNPDFDNSVASANFAFSGIDYVRLQYTVNDPNNCGDTGTVFLQMDFNQNCVVGFGDLANFVGFWLECTDPQDAFCDQFWR